MKGVPVFLLLAIVSYGKGSSVSDIINTFSVKLYTQLAKHELPNYVFSPLSIHEVLSIIYEGSNASTTDALQVELFEGWTQDSVRFGYATQREKLKTIQNLYTASKILVQSAGLPPVDITFSQVVEKDFESSIENFWYLDSSRVVNETNRWIKERTNGKIKNLLRLENLSPSSEIVLVSAIYFDGKWKIPFEPDITPNLFYVDTGFSYEVCMLHNIKEYKYGDVPYLDATILVLPYAKTSTETSRTLSMTIILPNERFGIKDLEKRLEDPKHVQRLLKETAPTTLVEVYIPKFKHSTIVMDLSDQLKQMGISKIFGDCADLSKIFGKSIYRHKITQIVHQAYIEITQLGTLATGGSSGTEDGQNIKIEGGEPAENRIIPLFRANHPFIVWIRIDNGPILFQGKVSSGEPYFPV